jgi:hypothetical protein
MENINNDKSTTYDMLLGRKTVEYLKQFEGTGVYNDIAKAIQFGFHLDEEITNEMGLEVEEDIKSREPKPLSNLEERFKREMSMVVMPLDNENIPEEDYYDEDSKDFEIASLVDFIDENDEPKQETLEQAAETCVLSNSDMRATHSMGEFAEFTFKEGAKWHAEQLSKDEAIQTLEKGLALLLKKTEGMYSEEEVRRISLDFFYHWYNAKGSNTEQGFDKWFQQFKKK